MWDIHGNDVKRLCMEKYRAVYITIPKVASQSIRKSLEIYKNGKEQDDFFKFSFVRNPFDRLLSCYFDKIIKMKATTLSMTIYNGLFYADMGLSDFVNAVCSIPNDKCDAHFKPQNLLLHDVDFIGKFENLENDFKYVLDLCGMPITNLNYHLNETPRNDLTFISSDIEKLTEKYKEDIRRFNYGSNLLCKSGFSY